MSHSLFEPDGFWLYATVQAKSIFFEFQVFFNHIVMFNCLFLSQLVPESNEIWYLGRTRTCLKELKVLLDLLIRRLKTYQLNKPLLKKIENQIRPIFTWKSHIITSSINCLLQMGHTLLSQFGPCFKIYQKLCSKITNKLRHVCTCHPVYCLQGYHKWLDVPH